MKVYCPHTQLTSETRAALDNSGYEWTAVDVSGSETAYTELMQKLWRQGESFAIVEHDIVPWRGALAELDECHHPWCGFSYPFGQGAIEGLGCTRFQDVLLAAYPSAVDDTLTEATEVHPRGHWCSLDGRLMRVLMRLGARRHVHGPLVGHLYPYPSHGC